MNFTKNATNLIINGKTFYAKEAIKAVGGRWDSILESWILPVHIDSDMLRKDLQEKALRIEKETKQKEKEQRASSAVTERQKILDCLEEKKKSGSYHWICCENCKVLDWRRQTTSCDACAKYCGHYNNSFRVRGMIYTGD